MRAVSKFAFAASLAGAIAVLAGPAVAGCKRMGFLVNDYGKEGPTKDAKALLDKHIATWAAEQGIEKYTVGKKEVKCELYLDFILFDEHTCTASATVCWGKDMAPAAQQTASKRGAGKPKAKEAAAKTAETKPAEVADKEAVAAKSQDQDVQNAKSVADQAAAESESSASADVETGALATEDKPAEESSPQVTEAADASSPATSSEALEAAEAAAAAAERAAAAAERAAAAAERAAAALSSTSETVPVPPGAANAAAASAQSAPAKVAPIRGTAEADDKLE